MADTSYDVFISYRRENGAAEARLIRAELERQGWRVFLDVEDLRRGYFDEALLRYIAEAPNFLVILSPNSLERCKNPDDWLQQEISQAVKTERNIIPIMMPGFSFPPDLDGSLAGLERLQGVEYSHTFFKAMVQRILDSLMRRPVQMSPFARMLAILTSPRKAFSDLQHDTSWWMPWLVLAIVWEIYAVLGDRGTEDTARNAALLRDLSYAAPVLLLATAVMLSAALMGLLKMVARREVALLTVLSVVMYSLVPDILRVGICAVVLQASQRPDAVTWLNAVPSSLASLLAPGHSSSVYVLAGAVDLFSLWSLALAAEGLASLLSLKWWKTAAIVAACYVIFTGAVAVLVPFLLTS